jgi:hypothetical protein
MARIIPQRRIKELKGPFPRTPKPDPLTQLRTANEIAKLVGTILEHPATDMIVGGLYRLFSDTDDPSTRARGEGALRLFAAQQGMTLEEVDTAIGVTKDALAEMDAASARETAAAKRIEDEKLAELARPRKEEGIAAAMYDTARDEKEYRRTKVNLETGAVGSLDPIAGTVDIGSPDMGEMTDPPTEYVPAVIPKGGPEIAPPAPGVRTGLLGLEEGYEEEDLKEPDWKDAPPPVVDGDDVVATREEVVEAEDAVERKARELADSKTRATRREVIEAKLKELLAAKETLTAVKGTEEIGYYELLAEASVADTDAEKKAVLEKLPLLQNYGPHIPSSLKDLIMGSYKTKAEGKIVDVLGLDENEMDKLRRAKREAGLPEATAAAKIASAKKAEARTSLYELEIGDYTERSQAKIKSLLARGDKAEADAEAKRLATRWKTIKFDLKAPKLEVDKLKADIDAAKARTAKALLARTVAPKGLRDGIKAAIRAYDTKLSAWTRRVADAEGAAAIDPVAITGGIIDLDTREKLRTQYQAKKQAAQKLLKVLKPKVTFAEKQKKDLQLLIPEVQNATMETDVDVRSAALKAIGTKFGIIIKKTPAAP